MPRRQMDEPQDIVVKKAWLSGITGIKTQRSGITWRNMALEVLTDDWLFADVYSPRWGREKHSNPPKLPPSLRHWTTLIADRLENPPPIVAKFREKILKASRKTNSR